MADRDPPRAMQTLRQALRGPTRARTSAHIARLPDGDVRRLRGVERMWRLSVGDWRVLFTIDAGRRAIDVLAVRPRGRAYD